MSGGRSGQVIDRGGADRLGGEVLGHPLGDLRTVVAAAGVVAAHAAAHAAAEAVAATDEVVDLSLDHVLLELGGRGGCGGSVVPSDRHHRVAGGQLVAGRVLRA